LWQTLSARLRRGEAELHRVLLFLGAMIPQFALAEVGFEIAPIRAIVLHLHEGVADRAFLPALEDRLQLDLAPPLYVVENAMDLSTTPQAFGKLEAEALVHSIAANLDPVENQGVIHVLLIDQDMQGPATRFNFAYSFGGAEASQRVIIVSLARLHGDRAELVAARVAGYSGGDLCVFGFPRDLRELDALAESYCEPDRAALVRGGLVRI
jgi:predicted Zn-dependent protease